ncbi:ABC transporter ATP-binding protein [Candidatus Woesearchaeota archaeon]|nr:ABC transporter ATP-binding protein [Candidatus Woesearchaeota archaeon]
MLIVKNLKKKYKDFLALKGISYEIKEGEIFGILGPNGAGKSTMIKILTCFHKPTSGTVTINDIPITNIKKIKPLIGWVPQEETFYPKLTVKENLEYFASLYEIPRKEFKQRSEEILRLLQIEHKTHSLAGSLSGGMKRRLSIAIALIHNPKIIYLDEPTAGVDPVSRRALWDIIRKIKQKGITILFCTHYLDEAELLCDRIAILRAGEIIAINTPSKLKKEYKTLEEAFIKLVEHENNKIS